MRFFGNAFLTFLVALTFVACNGGGSSSGNETTSTTTTAPGGGSFSGGHITYSANGRMYRVEAVENAAPEDISAALDSLVGGSSDEWLNISPDGQWLLFSSERTHPDCSGWACLAIMGASLESVDTVVAGGSVIHTEGLSAVGSGGNTIVYVQGDGPHDRDLWAISKSGGAWGAPSLLTGGSTEAFNEMPAISDDGRSVIFECGEASYTSNKSICEVGVDGSSFRVVKRPSAAPAGFTHIGGLRTPDYGPGGAIVFEADWGSEQVWRMSAGSTDPGLIGTSFNNDNSPCVLPSGAIVSLWLERAGGSSVHELKVMSADGGSYFMIQSLLDVDIMDIGMGCGA